MRRKEKQMPKDEVYKYLKKCTVVRLALFDNEYPYIVPMNYGFENADGKDILYMHCANDGKKLDLLKSNQKVGFEMDLDYGITNDETPSECTTKYASLIGTGLVEIVNSYTDKAHALSILMKEIAGREVQVFDKRIVDKTTILKLTIKNITGKTNID
ncbi:MAG: pyridoxamine 5'-phosphate oxidase family protein [Eubacteriales bacterium]